MKRALFSMTLLSALLLLVTAVYAAPGNGRRPADPPGQLVQLQLLAFNDYHGHLEASTPGALEGQPAGGSEYLSAKLSQLRQGKGG